MYQVRSLEPLLKITLLHWGKNLIICINWQCSPHSRKHDSSLAKKWVCAGDEIPVKKLQLLRGQVSLPSLLVALSSEASSSWVGKQSDYGVYGLQGDLWGTCPRTPQGGVPQGDKSILLGLCGKLMILCQVPCSCCRSGECCSTLCT